MRAISLSCPMSRQQQLSAALLGSSEPFGGFNLSVTYVFPLFPSFLCFRVIGGSSVADLLQHTASSQQKIGGSAAALVKKPKQDKNADGLAQRFH